MVVGCFGLGGRVRGGGVFYREVVEWWWGDSRDGGVGVLFIGWLGSE